MRKFGLMVALMLVALPMQAASVYWNYLSMSRGYPFEDGMAYAWDEPYFSFVTHVAGQNLILTATYGVFMEYAYDMGEVNKGDLIDASYAGQGWFCYMSGSGELDGSDISIPLGETFYLAYTVAYGSPMSGAYPDPSSPSRWGWVELKAEQNGELVLVRDAMSWGDPLVVGAIPEPAAGLLLLVGGAALALRRRRR